MFPRRSLFTGNKIPTLIEIKKIKEKCSGFISAPGSDHLANKGRTEHKKRQNVGKCLTCGSLSFKALLL
jgi:hypothetical protein